jgi:hypothetical protein
MNKSKIFFVGENENQLTEMVETPYEKEEILQLLLERYPDLLPGDQIDPENPRRWLLISREMGVPSRELGSGTWSLDHLFLDQDAVPTFVECKRAGDTRARREVVAQMLDYAANGIIYWSMDKLRQSAESIAHQRGRTLDEEIQNLLGVDHDQDIEEFWQQAEINLRKGKVRLLFVLDKTPQELRRLVEFLNEKMADVEVLVVEIKQFLGKGKNKVIVPRVVGFTETAREMKASSGMRTSHTNREEFLSKCDPDSALVFEHLLDKADEYGYFIYWGTVGFSTRYWAPEQKNAATYMLSFPPNLFQFYLGQLGFGEENNNRIRKELMATKLFKAGGKWTLSVNVTASNAGQVIQTIDHAFEMIKEELDRKQQGGNKNTRGQETGANASTLK